MAVNQGSSLRRSTRLPSRLAYPETDDDDDEDSELVAERLLNQFLNRNSNPPSTTRTSPANPLKRKAKCLADRRKSLISTSELPLSTTVNNAGKPGIRHDALETGSSPSKEQFSENNDNSENRSFSLIEKHDLPSPALSWTRQINNTHDSPSRTLAALPEATHNNNNTLESEISCAESSHTIFSQSTTETLPTISSITSRPSSFESPKKRRGRPPGRPNNMARPTETPYRRSERNADQRVHYYAPVPGFPGYGDEESETSLVEPMIEELPQPQLPSPAAKRIVDIARPRVLYQSDARCIIQVPLNPNSLDQEMPQDDDIDDELPYVSLEKRKNSGKLLSHADVGENGIIFHVDFMASEISTLYSIVTGKSIPDDDTPIQDHISEATRYVNVGLTSQRIKRVRELKRLLPSGFELDDLFNPASVHEEIPKRCQKVAKQIGKIFGDTPKKYQFEGYRKMIERIGRAAIKSVLAECHDLDGLKRRTHRTIQVFLLDAQARMLASIPSRLAAYIPSTSSPVHSVCSDANLPSALLRSRELGCTRHRGRNPVNSSLRNMRSRKWELWKTWKGASHDVMVLSWAPDGTQFVAGATVHCEENNMQYNRNNNLLLGDLAMGSIKELPNHHIPRPLITTGDYSNQDSFNSLDPNLYMTISAVQWRENHLFTASYDKTVKVWETQPELNCINTLSHPERLEVMDVYKFGRQLVATGCRDSNPVRIWSLSNDTWQSLALKEFPRYVPYSLVWGSNPSCGNMLVAGLSRKIARASYSSKSGSIVLWDVEAGEVNLQSEWEMSEHICDIKWHPSKPLFIAGCSTPSESTGTNTRSLLQVYDPLRSKHVANSFQCPALDINEVTFCPIDDNYITASCTDNLTYVWDRRNPSHILHKLGHGKPLNQLDVSVTQEEDDTGVCLAIWGGSNFYTGGSDGVVKCWDVRRSADDLVVDDIANFDHGVMSGALSPDQTNMIVGDSGGSIHVISTAPFSRENGQNLVYKEAKIGTQGGSESEISGVLEGRKWIESGQLSLHPKFGVGQGDYYE
ncbi:hypothetical protein FQN49_006167, partial [Arthroderma sp. PD_2]